MSTDGILEYQGTKRVLFRGDTSNIVFDTRTTSLGIGVTGSNDPSSNLYITGNAYVSSNLAIGGVMTMGVVNVAARHNLQAVTDMGNVTTHTVEFTNPDVGFTCTGTGVVKLPSGTTAQQPSTGLVAGMVRFNSDLNRLQVYNGTAWSSIGAVSATSTNSSITTVDGYTIHTFTSTGTFTVAVGGYVECLIVAGGGGGGARHGGGGGAGGMLTGTIGVNSNGVYTITVGAGGAGTPVGGTISGTNGSNSSAVGITAIGGGGGGGRSGIPGNGGSGGGGNTYGNNTATPGGTGNNRQGNNGGKSAPTHSDDYGGGGGGGAGAVGGDASQQVPGDGGIGLQSSISGTSTYYAGGGGGDSVSTGAGGSGLVIIRYKFQ